MKPGSSNAKSANKAAAEQVVKDIRRQTRRHFSAEDKIRIVLEGLRGDLPKTLALHRHASTYFGIMRLEIGGTVTNKVDQAEFVKAALDKVR